MNDFKIPDDKTNLDLIWDSIKHCRAAIGCLINAGEYMEIRVKQLERGTGHTKGTTKQPETGLECLLEMILKLEKRVEFLESMLKDNKFKQGQPDEKL